MIWYLGVGKVMGGGSGIGSTRLVWCWNGDGATVGARIGVAGSGVGGTGARKVLSCGIDLNGSSCSTGKRQIAVGGVSTFQSPYNMIDGLENHSPLGWWLGRHPWTALGARGRGGVAEVALEVEEREGPGIHCRIRGPGIQIDPLGFHIQITHRREDYSHIPHHRHLPTVLCIIGKEAADRDVRGG